MPDAVVVRYGTETTGVPVRLDHLREVHSAILAALGTPPSNVQIAPAALGERPAEALRAAAARAAAPGASVEDHAALAVALRVNGWPDEARSRCARLALDHPTDRVAAACVFATHGVSGAPAADAAPEAVQLASLAVLLREAPGMWAAGSSIALAAIARANAEGDADPASQALFAALRALPDDALTDTWATRALLDLHEGRAADVVQTPPPAQDVAHLSVWAAALAMVGRTDEAVAALTAAPPAWRAEAVKEARVRLSQLRAWDAQRALLPRIIDLEPDAAKARAIATALSPVIRVDALPRKLTVTQAAQLAILQAAAGATADEINATWAPQPPEALAKTVERLGAARSSQWTRAVFRDIALNAAAIVTPVDKDGWRVDVTWLNTQQTVWVVRNGKEHRILSHGAWVYPLIRRALAAFDAGDVAAARAWVSEATGQLPSLAVFGITGEEATALQSLLPPPSDDAALRRHLVAMDALTRADQSDTLIALAADLPLAGARGALRVASVKAEAEPQVRAWDALIALPGTPAERLFDVFHAPFSRVQDAEAMEAVVAARTEGADPGLVRFIRIATAAASADPAVLAQQVAALDPADPLTPREAALTAAMVDLPLEATAKHLDGMITFAMGSPTTAAWVIPVLLDHGRLDDAAALWRKAAEAADDDTANRFAEGRIAEALGLPTIALRAYDAVTDTIGRPAQAKARAAAIRAANPQPAP